MSENRINENVIKQGKINGRRWSGRQRFVKREKDIYQIQWRDVQLLINVAKYGQRKISMLLTSLLNFSTHEHTYKH